MDRKRLCLLSLRTGKGCPSLQIMHFFNNVQRALDPASLTFEHLVDFFDRLGGTFHCSDNSEEIMSIIP